MSQVKFDLKSIRSKEDRSPEHYILKNEGLVAAVQMALWLGKPLLLTGAPGTGKTQLAFKIAHLLANGSPAQEDVCAPFLEKPFVFNTKTTSTSTDLFYVYDAVRHFQSRFSHATADHHPVTAHAFIRMHALGNAIVQSFGAEAIRNSRDLQDLTQLTDFDKMIRPAPLSSVVLIDEIDKAPRDFPNDLLNEIENMEFYIHELMNRHIRKPDHNRTQILVIMTSNFEKALPDAFLRRCLFYHIPFPDTAELVEIVSARITPYLAEVYRDEPQKLQSVNAHLSQNAQATVNEFNKIREQIKDKMPTTSELLEWVKTLEKNGFFNDKLDFNDLDAEKKRLLSLSVPALAKSETDQKRLMKMYV